MADDERINDSKRSLIIKIVTITIVAIIITSTVVFFYNLNGKSLDFSDSSLLVVPTGSMDGEPTQYEISTIPKNSMIMVHGLSDDQKKDLAVGDVITFTQGGILKVHRIISIDAVSGTLVTKGDANQSADPQITFDDVSGKVVGVSAVVGGIISTLRNTLMHSPILMIVGLLLVIMMAITIMEIIKILRESKDEED